MDIIKLELGKRLSQRIEELKNDLTNCRIMLENKHKKLTISSNMAFNLPDSQAETILLIAKAAIEEELKKAEEEFEKL